MNTGTVLGGRYVIDRLVDSASPDEGWWAADHHLGRWVVITLVDDSDPGARPGPRDTSATSPIATRRHVTSRILDGGVHAGRSYLVLEAESAPALAGEARPPAARPAAARPAPPSTSRNADAAATWGDVRDPTGVLDVPAAAPAPAAPAPLGALRPLSGVSASRALPRAAGLIVAAFFVGVGSVVALGLLASPEPPATTEPATVADGAPDAQPTRTLPPPAESSSPNAPSSVPVAATDSTTSVAPTVPTTLPSTAPSTTVAPVQPQPPDPTPPPPPTSRRRRRWPFDLIGGRP